MGKGGQKSVCAVCSTNKEANNMNLHQQICDVGTELAHQEGIMRDEIFLATIFRGFGISQPEPMGSAYDLHVLIHASLQ